MAASQASFDDLAASADYSLIKTLRPDPEADSAGNDHRPRQVTSGHYVPVTPTPIADPQYVTHSQKLFAELGLDDDLARSPQFMQLFSGDLNNLPDPIRPTGWATGYALSIYGTEYDQQCPFRTGNGYGDGRAISVLEVLRQGKRWEMQLKGAGPTPYCRGADGRAVLRSSVREFLAQEHMHALGVPTSRSLSLFVSGSERVDRPWYIDNSTSAEPEVMVSNPVAITTRVAPSFLRVGQLELFARRVRRNAHAEALPELRMIVSHLIEREYANDIDRQQPFTSQVLQLAEVFCDRLTSLVTGWLRVGYCQGNFNSDNCAAGGFTLDYGPFGFCERFDPFYQPWIGGGQHFSFLNQPQAAERNFASFLSALMPLLAHDEQCVAQLKETHQTFATVMEKKLQAMWASKLGLAEYDSPLFMQLLKLMTETPVDFTLFFSELSQLPESVDGIRRSFYRQPEESLYRQWQAWFSDWRQKLQKHTDIDAVSRSMTAVNPRYTWREWFIVPAYEQAQAGDYGLIHDLQKMLTQPYAQQGQAIDDKYYQRQPDKFAERGGVSHYSCSS
ncbi:protein adenylyltransferase SelO [Alteromonas oceanisediminis]|uniref:protein adenylyltransferase SelO n=1 Tax=Alteromonas oceanisediminis TaxID=2836180 RepID=UPI001BDB420A|nr:protein adenylyltransferase SelO family protein [Alteromonas oceanisediminis]MBT0585641.1 YdiU family protein [Alteromonas oceanisediminis]